MSAAVVMFVDVLASVARVHDDSARIVSAFVGIGSQVAKGAVARRRPRDGRAARRIPGRSRPRLRAGAPLHPVVRGEVVLRVGDQLAVGRMVDGLHSDDAGL